MSKINSFPSIQQMTEQLSKNKESNKSTSSNYSSFEDILRTKTRVQTGELKFSKHANERLDSRNINLSDSQMERLESGVSKAYEKGIKESLVMVDDLAFIVNVKNNTVVTAVNDMDEKVFTNIDGAVIA